MYLQHLIKTALLLFSFSFIGTALSAYGDSTIHVPSPYKNEYNPWFKLSTFNRGFQKDSLTIILDELESKDRELWSRDDSLSFASTTLKTGNLELSNYYFDKLNPALSTEKNYWWSRMTLLMLNNEFDKALNIIHSDQPGILQFSELYFLEKIFEAKVIHSESPKWYKHNIITDFVVDSTKLKYDRWGEDYKTEIITPLSNLNNVLKRLIRHIHDSDPIISRTCFEMGLILETHVSWTQAYIAYSLGRNYNKRDKEILAQLKAVKRKLSKKKYKIPIFTRYFPSIKKWRFDYDVLKQKILLEKNDTLRKEKPVLMLPKQKFDFIVPPTLIIIGGIAFLFLMVLLFVKTRKK